MLCEERIKAGVAIKNKTGNKLFLANLWLKKNIETIASNEKGK